MPKPTDSDKRPHIELPKKPREKLHWNAILQDYWRAIARNDQLAPQGDWLIWLILAGRGAGKTRAGAEWVRGQVAAGCRHVALVAPTYHIAREVMLNGPSGLLNVGAEAERPHYVASRRRLEWKNGAVGLVFSSEDPDGLRGPQFDCAWADEFCAWTYPEDTLYNLRLGLRLGSRPRLVVTTTPKPTAALKALMKAEGVVISRASTLQNMQNLSPVFISAVTSAYGGTRLGRQELGGELIEDLPGALWTRDSLSGCLKKPPEAFDKIIVSVDPPVTSGARSDACGIIIAGLVRGAVARQDHVYILHDGTVQGVVPDVWARRVVSLWESYEADHVLAEVNQGGEMVSTILRSHNPDVLVKTVYASRGKVVRAEPIAMLYSQGRVFHARPFAELEDELAMMGTEMMLRGSKSPDRADALVWAVTHLLLQPRKPPRIRQI